MKKSLEERFWEKVDIRGPDECWTWKAGTSKKGYGRISIMGRPENASRIAYLLTKGPIPAGMRICHSCDCRPCQNPKHLWPGTDKDNAHDCIKKGRKASAEGEQNGNAKLTEEDVHKVRQMAQEGVRLAKIAKFMGVSLKQISNIIHHKSWRKRDEDE